jgi:hypothetical protein
MTYSYTQISQYLSCPRRYRHRYLDGWQEKDMRAAMLFGRAFEQAVAALFRREDPAAVLFEQWGLYKDMGLTLYLVCISPDPLFPASGELDRASAGGRDDLRRVCSAAWE